MKSSISRLLLLSMTFVIAYEMNGQRQNIDDCIRPYVTTNNFSGTVFVVKKGNVIYLQSFGKASIELNVCNMNKTVYHLASVSKPITATAILLLEQQGKLSVNDKLTKYIPDFENGDKITIHHLLIHSSGIPNINNFPEYDSISMFPQTTGALINVFKKRKSQFPPGSKYSYSNSNYNVLAYIIEKVSGQSFGEFIRKNIFDPLGMKQTSHHFTAEDLIPNSASGYMDDGALNLKRAGYVDWTSKTGNGSLYSTVEDLYKFCRSFAGNSLLTQESRDKMFTNYISNTGYGWFLRPDNNRKRMYINGRSPGFTSFMAIYPDEELYIIVLCNLYIPVPTEIGNNIAQIIAGKAVTTYKFDQNKLSESQLTEAVGRYKFDSSFFRPNYVLEVIKVDGRLVTSFGGLTHLVKDSFVLRSFWSDLMFERNEKGKIIGLDYDGYKARRIEDD